jgi:hypothetical protein
LLTYPPLSLPLPLPRPQHVCAELLPICLGVTERIALRWVPQCTRVGVVHLVHLSVLRPQLLREIDECSARREAARGGAEQCRACFVALPYRLVKGFV